MKNRNLPERYQTSVPAFQAMRKKARSALTSIWDAFKRPLTHLEESRLNWGIAPEKHGTPMLGASIHRGRAGDLYDGYASLEKMQGFPWFDRELIKLETLELNNTTLEQIRTFIMGLGQKTEEFNAGKDLTDTFKSIEDAMESHDNSDMPFRVTIMFFEALDKYGDTFKRQNLEDEVMRETAGFGTSFSNRIGALKSFKELEKILVGKKIFATKAPAQQNIPLIKQHDDAMPS